MDFVAVLILVCAAPLLVAFFLHDTRRVTYLRRFALIETLVFTVLGGLFIGGETFADPGGQQALLVTLLWAVPLVVLTLLAWLKPDLARPVLVVVSVLALAAATVNVIAPDWSRSMMDRFGPWTAVSTFALGLPWVIYGFKRNARFAGWWLVAVMAIPVVAEMVAFNWHVLFGSSGAAAGPLLVPAIALLWADASK